MFLINDWIFLLIIFKQSKNKLNVLHFIDWINISTLWDIRNRIADVTRRSPGVSSRWAEHMVTVEAAGFPEALVCLPGNYLRALGRRGGLWESHLRSARCLKDLKKLRAAAEAPSSPPASFPRLLSSSVLKPWSLGMSINSCDLSHSRYCRSKYFMSAKTHDSVWPPAGTGSWLTAQANQSNENVFPFGLFTKTDACSRDWHDLSGNGSRLSDLEEPDMRSVVFSTSLLVFYC